MIVTAQFFFKDKLNPLGTIGTGKHFKQKIQKIVQEYIGSHSPYDLVFTTGKKHYNRIHCDLSYNFDFF